MKLSDRMEKIVEMCGRSNVWADIGCDHGRVSAELILRGIADHVIAADVSELSLYKAKDLSASLGLTDKISCRWGNGLKVLDRGEADGAVIAGMGTPLIEKIIGSSIDIAKDMKELVLSPNNYPHRLRKWLIDNGFDILAETAAEDDGRFYPIMKVSAGEGIELSERELYCGRNVIPCEAYDRYIDWLADREADIIKSIETGGGSFGEHKHLSELYEEVKNDNGKRV